jgi:2-polyprenyl-3-methyl-5-hydroxy-6-metoxy-1,4-benzoquinol methylase
MAARFTRTMEKNDLSAFQTMYANPKYVKLYLDPQRLAFYENLADTIATFVDLSHPDLAYLDVGCGTGHLMEAIRRRGMCGTIVGCDYAATASAVVKEVCAGAQFEVRDVYNLGITSSYDFITCCETLEHLKYPEQAISNMLAAIKPGGKLFLTVPDGRKDTWEGHIHFWSPESFALLLERFGRSESLYVDNCNFGVLFR